MTTPFSGAGAPLTQAGLDSVIKTVGCDLPSLWAVMAVETRGFGFLPLTRQPKILFERHVFYRLTGGAHGNNGDISSSKSGGYLGGAAEYARLEAAAKLNQEAAIGSASWGLGQIMGYHAKRLKYASAMDMAQAFGKGEDEQISAMGKFIATESELAKALVAGNWRKVAFYYNGSNYAKNEYDAKLEYHYEKYRQQGCPDVQVREAQALLTYLKYNPKGIDGFWGNNSKKALASFLVDEHMPAADKPDTLILAALRKKAGV